MIFSVQKRTQPIKIIPWSPQEQAFVSQKPRESVCSALDFGLLKGRTDSTGPGFEDSVKRDRDLLQVHISSRRNFSFSSVAPFSNSPFCVT